MWDRRQDGELNLTVLMSFELAVGEGQEVAVRIEHATTQEELFEQAPPKAVQLVMDADAADALAADLILAANRARGAASN